MSTATGGEPTGRRMTLHQPRHHTSLEVISTQNEVICLTDNTDYDTDA